MIIQKPLILVLLTLFTTAAVQSAEKPLKVYILAGQSNMEGQAKVRTISAMRNDSEAAELYKDMTDKDGEPITVDDVFITFGERSGKLNATFGGLRRRGGPRMGSEYAFGIYMHKHLKEPILLIKTAWGGKNLHTQFRPPSAEPEKGAGEYYQKMMTEAKAALSNIKKVYPDYNEKAGYTIDGFVWFQGFNDMIDGKTYPNRDKAGGFQKYTDYLCHFIRDVRKDLSAPKMKFVIGAIGTGGIAATDVKGIPRGKGASGIVLQRAQAAPAAMPEFKSNVAAVYAAKYWDHRLTPIERKLKTVSRRMKSAGRKKKLSREQSSALNKKLMESVLTEEERELAKGISDGGFHYLGSAKIYGRIGKAFADAMVTLGSK